MGAPIHQVEYLISHTVETDEFVSAHIDGSPEDSVQGHVAGAIGWMAAYITPSAMIGGEMKNHVTIPGGILRYTCVAQIALQEINIVLHSHQILQLAAGQVIRDSHGSGPFLQ